MKNIDKSIIFLLIGIGFAVMVGISVFYMLFISLFAMPFAVIGLVGCIFSVKVSDYLFFKKDRRRNRVEHTN